LDAAACLCRMAINNEEMIQSAVYLADRLPLVYLLHHQFLIAYGAFLVHSLDCLFQAFTGQKNSVALTFGAREYDTNEDPSWRT